MAPDVQALCREEFPLLSVQGLCFRYGEDATAPLVLSDVSFELREGEWLAVVGSNGSGKSTLARHLNGLLRPSAGRVSVVGYDTQDEAAARVIRRHVGMVFQNPDNQIIAAVVEEDVAFGPENLGLPPAEIRARVAWALDQVGLWALRGRAPAQLSGGQKQRLAIAGALAMQPRLLVLDEPSAMLDPQGAREVLTIVEKLRDEQRLAVVWISHRMAEVARADRVLALESGRTAFLGQPERFFRDPALLARLGLEQPPSARLAQALREDGWHLPVGLVRPETVAAAIIQQGQRTQGAGVP